MSRSSSHASGVVDGAVVVGAKDIKSSLNRNLSRIISGRFLLLSQGNCLESTECIPRVSDTCQLSQKEICAIIM